MYCRKNIDYKRQCHKWNKTSVSIDLSVHSIKRQVIDMIFVGFDVPVAGKWPEKKVQFCLFFLKIWPKTYPHFYEKQRYNLEWPNIEGITQQFVWKGGSQHCVNN